MKRLYVLMLFLTGCGYLQAQIVLQIEKKGSPKTIKIETGRQIEYQLYEYEDWQQGIVDRLIPEEDIIVLNDRYIKVSDIRQIRFDTPQKWSRPLGRNLALFGAAWGVYSGIAAIVDEDDSFGWGDASITVGAPLTGFLLQRIFRYKKYRMDGPHRLRILDMRVD